MFSEILILTVWMFTEPKVPRTVKYYKKTNNFQTSKTPTTSRQEKSISG